MTPDLSHSEEIIDTGCEIIYYPNFVAAKAEVLLDIFYAQLNWQKEYLTLYGKTVESPRLTALYGDTGVKYRYSGTTHKANLWTQELTALKRVVEQVSNQGYNSVLANLYRSGEDSMGWHSDDESELGLRPTVASLSFGANRDFILRNKADTSEQHKFNLATGSLLIMSGETQKYWQHSLPKRKRCIKPRVNLSFRNILS